jgi:hypothetical protein
MSLLHQRNGGTDLRPDDQQLRRVFLHDARIERIGVGEVN